MDKPEYIPLPRTGTKCPYCGLSRSGLNNLILPMKSNGFKAVVDSSTPRQSGKNRGRRLIHYASLMKYLSGQMVPAGTASIRRSWLTFRSKARSSSGKTPVETASYEFMDEQAAEAAEASAMSAMPG